jgi:uncharacterized protein
MILPIIALGKEPQTLELKGEAADMVELAQAGASGALGIRLDVTPLAGDSHLVHGEATGILAAECGRCLEPMPLPFAVKFDLLVERKDSTGLEWMEDEDQGVEDYQAHAGPDVTEIPLDSIIVEQVLLNYNLHPLPDLDAAGCCVQCGRPAPTVPEPKKAEGVDPRWAKLQEIKVSKGDSSANGSTKPVPRKKS